MICFTFAAKIIRSLYFFAIAVSIKGTLLRYFSLNKNSLDKIAIN